MGVSLVPALTSSPITSVNSNMGEEGERVSGNNSGLDGVGGGHVGEGESSKVIISEGDGDSSSRL